MQLATLRFELKLQKGITMGITIFKFSFGEVYRRIYVQKSRFTARLARRSKTKFPTVYPTIYLPKWKFWIQLSPNYAIMLFYLGACHGYKSICLFIDIIFLSGITKKISQHHKGCLLLYLQIWCLEEYWRPNIYPLYSRISLIWSPQDQNFFSQLLH